MAENMTQQLAALERMTTGELAERYAELHGQQCRTRHRAYLLRKVAWRMQALAEGDLSERARRRAEELANDADVRVMPPRASSGLGNASTAPRVVTVSIQCDRRLPAAGRALVRDYKGRTIRVIVASDGFEYEGERYKTLTAVAEVVTGTHINGFRFFRLGGKA